MCIYIDGSPFKRKGKSVTQERNEIMKKRIISLTLALILLVGVLVVPVNAASAKDVHNYLKEFAKSGE